MCSKNLTNSFTYKELSTFEWKKKKPYRYIYPQTKEYCPKTTEITNCEKDQDIDYITHITILTSVTQR